MEERIKLIVTDDKEEYRRIFLSMVDGYSFIDVIGQAENGKDLLHLLRTRRPDVILLDLNMPVMDGNETFKNLCKNHPSAKVIILSQHFEPVLVENYIQRGARGYLPKDAIMTNEILLINAITKVKNGGTFVYDSKMQGDHFTRRQKELLPLIFDGYTNDAIAKEIGISKRAVEKHKQKLYEKAGTLRSIDFYKYAFLRGLQFLGRIMNKGGKKVSA